jgi:hypothetical protein
MVGMMIIMTRIIVVMTVVLGERRGGEGSRDEHGEAQRAGQHLAHRSLLSGPCPS